MVDFSADSTGTFCVFCRQFYGQFCKLFAGSFKGSFASV
jgi:hypothetical protein